MIARPLFVGALFLGLCAHALHPAQIALAQADQPSLTPHRAAPTDYPVYSPKQRDALLGKVSGSILSIAVAGMRFGDDEPEDPHAREALIKEARTALMPLLADPQTPDPDAWRSAGGLALITDDAVLGAYAHDALTRMTPSEETQEWRPEMIVRLAALPISDRLESIPDDRADFLAAITTARKTDTDPKIAAAMREVAMRYEQGVGVPPSEAQAHHWYQLAADRGDAPAMGSLGLMLHRGQGGEKDPVLGTQWLQKSAELGFPQGMYDLAVCLDQGLGLPRDKDEAMRWYLKAAQVNHPKAMLALAGRYIHGDGVENDMQQATAWFQRAADAGNSTAMFNLGTIYFQGLSVEEDVGLAMSWLIKAGEAGNVEAMWAAAQIYLSGNKVDQNDELAARWMQSAADQGHRAAMYSLGVMLYNGTGVDKDEDTGIQWIRKAARLGDPGALDAMKQIDP